MTTTIRQTAKKYGISKQAIMTRFARYNITPVVTQPSRGKPALYDAAAVDQLMSAIPLNSVRVANIPADHLSVREFATEQKCHMNKVYIGLRVLRSKRLVKTVPGIGRSSYYSRADLAEALELEKSERYAAIAAAAPDSFAIDAADPSRLVTLADFARRHGLNVLSARARVAGHGLLPVNQKQCRRDPGLYRAGDLVELLRKYPAKRETEVEVAAKAAKRQRFTWVKHHIGARLRITNVAGRQWTGIFSGYKGDALATITLGDGAEMVFARDAVVEAVADSVPLSPCDGFNGKFDDLDKFYIDFFAANRSYAAIAPSAVAPLRHCAAATAAASERTVRQVIRHRRL